VLGHSGADPDLRAGGGASGITLAKTPFGRKVYAVGGNGTGGHLLRASAGAGGVHLLPDLAFCVATAGLIQASRSLGSQNTVGQGLELEVLAAVILGGASLLGGSGTIFKTVDRRPDPGLHPERPAAGRAAVLRQYVVTWVIIILAVWLDIAAKRGALVTDRVRGTNEQPKALSRLIKRGAIWGFIVLELIFFSIAGSYLSLSDKAFMDLDNMLLLLKQSAPIGIIALGMTVIMINGNIDLSVGATFALAAIVMLDSMTWPVFAGLWRLGHPGLLVLALLTGVALGAVNGLIVWKTGVDAFIVTLGAMLGYRGLVFMYNGESRPRTSTGRWSISPRRSFLGLHTATWFLIAVVGGDVVLMNRTVHGRNAYAIGDNREAAVNAGIRVGPHMMINFMLIGFLAALSAVVFYSESGSVNPNDGELYELWVITAVVLGGTKLTGGAGSVISTLGGVIAIQLLRKGWATSARTPKPSIWSSA
jgi:ribose transport system permease protein